MSAFKTWWTAFKSLVNPLALFITNEHGLFPSDDSQSRTRITSEVASRIFLISWILWTLYALFFCRSYQVAGIVLCTLGAMFMIAAFYFGKIEGSDYALKLQHYLLLLTVVAAVFYLIGHFFSHLTIVQRRR
jgi:VIT1/CCC1 family predicted Fe2+/Mn2+ transporter